MKTARFKIRNYRCFGAQKPLEFELSDGFIAFIGPNNAGKSAVLKFFYEFREIWSVLQDSNLNILLKGGPRESSFHDVIYPFEPFHKFNNEHINLTIEIDDFSIEILINKKNNERVDCKRHTVTIARKEYSPKHIDFNSSSKMFVYRNEKGSHEKDASAFVELIDLLKRVIYIPVFRNIVNIGENKNYFDIPTGTAFIKEWNDWKVGRNSERSQIIINITEDIKKLFEYEDLEINASVELNTLQITINGQSFKLSEIGSGIAQFILVFATAALRKPSFILIDEPELNLHPSLQIDFLTNLTSYTQNGVLFSTHSIGLARSVADKVYSVSQKSKNNYSSIHILEKTPNYAQFLGEMGFGSYQELGARKVLLVEGPTEVRTFQQFLRLHNKDKDVVILSLGGSSMINGKREQELSEISRVTRSPNNVFAWVDSEKTSKKSLPLKERGDFLKSCKKLKFKVAISERRATENYLTTEAIQKIKGTGVDMLGQYEKLNELSNHWSKKENWLIARQMTWGDIKDTDLGKFLKNI